MPQSPFVLQSEIERKTGFGIEQLRKWRQRFGFPPAQYEVSGRAIYSRDSVDRLLVISTCWKPGCARVKSWPIQQPKIYKSALTYSW
jgi:hypothetical protein